ncbi:uncharacterized protein A1O9_01943 [Exophiala aquamarina CBS 119918]|uniref:Uncharacterized protein n=1 Tax=Exophiala aquamarina CBS 119918 TaxID=1182545 RepID=A0A072PM27_9EURO|nr:uncharacterized protein A1O9_01943 [Exophiala aquamarina CBS 119918]KEF60383.1 hypothetical protein A1O9_01943 [Exophiala aquamarina CBS 119918]
MHIDGQTSSPALVLLNFISRNNKHIPSSIILLEHAHHIALGPPLALTQKPIILARRTNANKQVNPQMFHRSPILLLQTHEEVVQTQVVAEGKGSSFLALSDKRSHLAEYLTAHSKDAIVAESIYGNVLAAVTKSVGRQVVETMHEALKYEESHLGLSVLFRNVPWVRSAVATHRSTPYGRLIGIASHNQPTMSSAFVSQLRELLTSYNQRNTEPTTYS